MSCRAVMVRSPVQWCSLVWPPRCAIDCSFSCVLTTLPWTNNHHVCVLCALARSLARRRGAVDAADRAADPDFSVLCHVADRKSARLCRVAAGVQRFRARRLLAALDRLRRGRNAVSNQARRQGLCESSERSEASQVSDFARRSRSRGRSRNCNSDRDWNRNCNSNSNTNTNTNSNSNSPSGCRARRVCARRVRVA